MEKRQASSFYPHFAKNERPTVDRLVGLFNELVFKHQPILTDFLDPGQRDILRIIAGNDAIINEFGGYKNAEKQRIILSEDWINLQPADYQVSAYQIDYPKKFFRLNHSAILGTLANSGITTSSFGDIINDENENWQFFGKSELDQFYIDQIDRIGRSKVKVKKIKFNEVIIPEDNSVPAEGVVSSLRVDSVLAAISKKSRVQIQKQIEDKQVKLNWHEINNSNIMVKETDVLSLRHFGRLELTNVASTRKGKFKVVFRLWQTKKKKSH